jgi:hypothetical protein
LINGLPADHHGSRSPALRLSGATNIAAALRHHTSDTRRPLDTYKIT